MTDSLERVRRLLGSLTPDELHSLAQDIAALLGAEGSNDTPPTGHIELKMINGYGPYKYLRRLEGGKLRSIYLGKAAPGDAARYAKRRVKRHPKRDDT